MSNPDSISVIMACYNSERTIRKAIDSIMNQTYSDWVMICCDDGSTDHTVEILREYQNEHPEKFIILENGKNMKLPFSLNRCLKEVKTEYVARMDADDWSTPDRFQKQIDFLKAHPKVDLVGSEIGVSDGENTLATIIQKEWPVAADMYNMSCFSHATVMTHSYVYRKLNGYSLDPRVERSEDIDLWSRFFQAGFTGYNIPEILYYVLEDANAVKRRNFKARLNAFYTIRQVYKRLRITGLKARIRPWVQLGKVLVPTKLYNKLHLKSIKKNYS